MEMQPVVSSQVSAVGYDAEAKTMHVTFKSGPTYEYTECEPHVHERLIGAESIGRQLKGIVAGLPYKKL